MVNKQTFFRIISYCHLLFTTLPNILFLVGTLSLIFTDNVLLDVFNISNIIVSSILICLSFQILFVLIMKFNFIKYIIFSNLLINIISYFVLLIIVSELDKCNWRLYYYLCYICIIYCQVFQFALILSVNKTDENYIFCQ